MTGPNELSILVHGPAQKGSGPVMTAAVIFRCEGCQYLQPKSDECPGIDQINWTCGRENKLIGTTQDTTIFPSTPNWCAFKMYADRDAVKATAELMDRVERRNMPAIRLTKITKGMHPSERCAHFPIIALPNHGISGITKPTRVEATCLASERQFIDDRLIVHFVAYNDDRKIALVEFPDEVTPGMSRRNWVECTQLVNMPAR